MSVDLVVARYLEDTSWMAGIPAGLRSVMIYDKGGRKGGIQLPNIGREAHTYLYHILTHYDDLANTTVFCQGDPFDSCPHFMQALEDAVVSPPSGFTTWGFRLACDPEGRPHHADQFNGELLRCREIWRDLTGRDIQPRIEFVCGAQFAVSSACIRAWPLSVYRKAAHWAIRDKTFAWSMERLWELLWTSRPGMMTRLKMAVGMSA